MAIRVIYFVKTTFNHICDYSSDTKRRKTEASVQSMKAWDPDISKPFLEEAVRLDPRALSCGMQGFIILHSLMSLASNATPLSSCIHVCEAPTYYGMMAASFCPE